MQRRLEEGIKPCNYLDNDSIVVSGLEEWSPGNFDHSVGGKYSLNRCPCSLHEHTHF